MAISDKNSDFLLQFHIIIVILQPKIKIRFINQRLIEMFKKILIGVALVALAITMGRTVPDKKAHKEAMMEAVRAYVDDEAIEHGLGDNILTDLGKGIVNKTIEVALNSKLEVDNYFLFNTTHVELGDESKTLSLGIFGHVFTFDKEMLRDAVEEAAQEKVQLKEERKAAKLAEKEARKLEKQLKKEQRKREKEARKAAKRAEKEAKKREKEARKRAKELEKQNKQ